MIGGEQLQRLQEWLAAHPRSAQVRGQQRTLLAEPTSEDAEARWSSSAYRGQRDRLLDFVASQNLQGGVFLSGDSHNSFPMETDHELGASPINGWFLRGQEMYQPQKQDQTAAGTPDSTRLDGQVSIHRTHRDDPAGRYANGRFSLNLP